MIQCHRVGGGGTHPCSKVKTYLHVVQHMWVMSAQQHAAQASDQSSPFGRWIPPQHNMKMQMVLGVCLIVMAAHNHFSVGLPAAESVVLPPPTIRQRPIRRLEHLAAAGGAMPHQHLRHDHELLAVQIGLGVTWQGRITRLPRKVHSLTKHSNLVVYAIKIVVYNLRLQWPASVSI
jgi:hypothetical protein